MTDFIALLAQCKIVVDPTLATFDFVRQRDGELSKAYAAVADHVPPDVQIATYNGAKCARVLDDRGVILPGKRADLILVDGDPTQNISDIRKVALVIKGDMAYYPSEIHEALGVKPFTEPLAVN